METNTNAENAVKYLEKSVNCMGLQTEAKYIVESMLNLHRTLNQAFTGNIVLPFIFEMAQNYSKGDCDGRNEFACKCCSIMAEALQKELGYFPSSLALV
jgi:hypothetical protein